jgi:soluble lytic murein transglycosylase
MTVKALGRLPLIAAVIVLATVRGNAHPAANLAGVEPVLAPTNHPIVPADLSQLWLAPEVEKNRTRSAVLDQFVEGVKLEVDSNFARALPIFSRSALQQGVLGHYAIYYKGLAEMRIGRPTEARTTFRGLAAQGPVGYLAEVTALREAECNEALGDQRAAAAIYERLVTTKTTAPEDVLMRLGRVAKLIGDREKAAAAFSRVYYEFPLSEQATAAAIELDAIQPPGLVAGSNRYRLELARANRLFVAKRYTDARSSFERLRSAAQRDDRDLIALRLAECDYFLKRSRNPRDAFKPFIDKGSRRAEALFYFALAARDMGDEAEYLRVVRRIADEFPKEKWAEEALNNLATRSIIQNNDARADAAFRELIDKFPSGRYAERAAWKIGWWAYRNGQYGDTIRYFEGGAVAFPRSDYRPAWLYWSGRAYDGLKQPAQAHARYTLTATDYLNSYYGRLAVTRLPGGAPERRLVVDTNSPGAGSGESPLPVVSLPPNHHVVRALLGLKLYDQALDEVRYAQRVWGDSSALQASTAWIYQQQGQVESGTRQFTLLRGAITTMRRAYPQFLAAGGESLPRELLSVIFPIGYWDLIRKHAAEQRLDPYLVAALVAQESTFVPDIRSSANAVGLMQLLPSTARQYANTLKLKFSSALMTTPESNIRLGTAYLADKVKEFGDIHLVLASYNAGERAVRRWLSERPSLGRDEFIDDIPFPETQHYVKKIIGTTEDYRRLYGEESAVLLQAVNAKAEAAPPPRKPKVAPVALKKKPALPSSKKPRGTPKPA